MSEQSTENTEQASEPGSVSSQYRTAAGLPARESDGPTDPGADLSRAKHYEPEGGYGGEGSEGGITNTAGINASEEARAEQRDAQAEKRVERIEETGLTGGETATEVAIVTGEPIIDEKPGRGYTPEDELPESDKE